MNEFCTEIEIQASDTRVWQLLTDFANFPSGTPLSAGQKGKPSLEYMGKTVPTFICTL